MTDRERLGRAAFEAHYGGVSPTHAWEDISTGYREAWCVAAEAVRALVRAEAPAEAPTRPDRKMTPSPFAAVKPALEAGREAAGLDQEPKP